MSGTAADGDALRAMIREVLADLLPGTFTAAVGNGAGSASNRAAPVGNGAASAAVPPVVAPGEPPQPGAALAGLLRLGAARPGPPQPGSAHTVHEDIDAVQTVSLRTDADLSAFVMRLLHLFENPKHRDALRAGRLRFRLAPAAAPGSALPAHRVEKGAVTEATVRHAAQAGARLVLGRRAVLTPLARDRARAAGVEIERER